MKAAVGLREFQVALFWKAGEGLYTRKREHFFRSWMVRKGDRPMSPKLTETL